MSSYSFIEAPYLAQPIFDLLVEPEIVIPHVPVCHDAIQVQLPKHRRPEGYFQTELRVALGHQALTVALLGVDAEWLPFRIEWMETEAQKLGSQPPHQVLAGPVGSLALARSQEHNAVRWFLGAPDHDVLDVLSQEGLRRFFNLVVGYAYESQGHTPPGY